MEIADLAPDGYVGTPSFLRIILEKADEQGVALPSLGRELQASAVQLGLVEQLYVLSRRMLARVEPGLANRPGTELRLAPQPLATKVQTAAEPDERADAHMVSGSPKPE